MKLNLQLHSSPRGPIRAAFLRGSDPQHWLSTLQSWGISPSDLEAYAVPQSKSDLRVAGLLLIQRQGHFPAQLDLQEAYRCVGDALLIPQCASIQPQVAEEEWKNLLFYDWHFFHPGIGMVGFQLSDRISLADLLTYPEALEQDWTLAKPGPPSAPTLRQISVLQPKVEDLFAQVQGVGDKDLKDLSKNKPSSKDDKDPRTTLLNSLEKLLRQRPNLREGESQGWLGKMLDHLEMRIGKMIADLQKQRESEIDRLLKLYQDDPEEALRYSIPLDSPYEGRGIAPPSGLLGRNNAPDFNLGGLNTGGPRDNWNLDAQRQIALRQHYLRLANQKIAEGDYRKAAYIHAHLLGDFHTAANVLEQGKHFYEAAILYRDHLKDKQRAAQCFEKGGLYTEAIGLYLELDQKEKAGDLYTQIDQWAEAEKLYQSCAEEALKTSNHLEAARIYDQKLKDQNEAKASLLKGWHDKLNPTACLNRYFDFFQNASNDEFDAEVQRIYQEEYKPMQHNAFMEVLKEIGKNKQRRAELPNTREIVYHVVSNELQSDILDHVGMLETFVAKDRLLGGDVSRYSSEVKQRNAARKVHSIASTKISKKAHLVQEINLPEGIQWLEALILNHIFLVLGKMGNHIYLNCSDLEMRNDAYNIGYCSTHPNYHIFALAHHTNYLGITQFRWRTGSFEMIDNSFGKELQRLDMIFPKTVIAICPVAQEKIAKLESNIDGHLILHYCKPNGEILESLLCLNESGTQPWQSFIPYEKPLLMHYRHGHFYFIVPFSANLIRIDPQGKITAEVFSAPVRKIAVSDENTALRIVVGVGGTSVSDPYGWYGCYYYRPTFNGFQACGEAFELGGEIENLLFTSTGLIVTEQNQVRIYDTHGHTTPRKIGSFATDGNIVDAFLGTKADQVGFLTKEGKVLFYEIGDMES
jgi:MoxR-vWA-beta-propeller ternary system domain bpX3